MYETTNNGQKYIHQDQLSIFEVEPCFFFSEGIVMLVASLGLAGLCEFRSASVRLSFIGYNHSAHGGGGQFPETMPPKNQSHHNPTNPHHICVMYGNCTAPSLANSSCFQKKTPQGSGKDSWGGRKMVLADPMGVPGPEGFQLAAGMAAKNKRKQKKYHKPS